jgi:hypothetical protein
VVDGWICICCVPVGVFALNAVLARSAHFVFLERPTIQGSPSTFAEWGMHAYLIAQLDPQDRRHVLAGVNARGIGSGGMGLLSGDNNTRRRLLDSGLPLAVLELAA